MSPVATLPPLWEHQQRAVDFALERKATLLHYGMGTGKSRIAIEIARQTGARKILVLCPLSVCDAWLDQFVTFGRDFRVAVLNKGTVARKAKYAKGMSETALAHGEALVVVVNYESARNNPLAAWLSAQKFDLLILDESHRIKSPSGTTSRWVSRLAQTCGKRLALTGTPMPQARMARITVQADRSVLDLPDATHQRRVVDLSPKARRMYAEMESDFCTSVREGEVTAANALVKLLRLQQMTSGRVTVETDTDSSLVKVDDAKEKALVDLLTDLPADEPVVIFGRFRADIASAHAAAKAVGRASLELSGQRRELKEWQQGVAPVLAVQIQSGGTGIDLTRAAIVCFLSTGFSLGDYEQALARNHRPGQTRNVSYYHFVARDTVDEQVYGALRARKQVVEAVLDGIHNPNP